ncbi:MAG: transcriptional regulator NrdR, partial [candidate division NC10 bacterium]|nr:transcriptional regulator NrdR [candidate division NC10 bacterium]
MRCPFCGSNAEKVVVSREGRDGEVIRRRRQCLHC